MNAKKNPNFTTLVKFLDIGNKYSKVPKIKVYFRILRHFNAWIGIADWSKTLKISVKYLSITSHKPAEITT